MSHLDIIRSTTRSKNVTTLFARLGKTALLAHWALPQHFSHPRRLGDVRFQQTHPTRSRSGWALNRTAIMQQGIFMCVARPMQAGYIQGNSWSPIDGAISDGGVPNRHPARMTCSWTRASWPRGPLVRHSLVERKLTGPHFIFVEQR